MEQSIRCGIDIAKLVFQIHGVNAKSGETVMVKKLARHDMLHFFVNKPHMLIGIDRGLASQRPQAASGALC